MEGATDLCRKEIVIDSWEEVLLEILKSKVPVESIVLLPLGERGLRVQFICSGLITKKPQLYPVILNMNKTYPRREKAGYSMYPPLYKRTLNYKSMSDLKED